MDGMGRLERLVEFCKLLYSVSKIPIHIFDEQSMIYSCPDLEPLNKMEIARPVREELMSSAKKKPLLETFNSVVLYACIHFEERKDYYIFLGPALLNEPSRFDIRSLYPVSYTHLKDGDIVEQGKHEELLAKNGFYANLYNSQFAQKQLAE